MQDPLLRRLSGDDPEQFRSLWGAVCEVSGYLTAEDCRAMAEICYDGALPAFSEEQQQRFTFLFFEGELAHVSKSGSCGPTPPRRTSTGRELFTAAFKSPTRRAARRFSKR